MSVLPYGTVIREASMDDAAILAELMAEMDDDDPQRQPASSTEAMRLVLRTMAGYRFFRAYLVLEHEVPVATFSLMIFTSPAHQCTPQALLDAVVVTRAHRNIGIGEAMIKHAMEIARAAGCYKMMLSSNLKRVAAHRFYEHLGFHQHGISLAVPIEAPEHA